MLLELSEWEFHNTTTNNSSFNNNDNNNNRNNNISKTSLEHLEIRFRNNGKALTLEPLDVQFHNSNYNKTLSWEHQEFHNNLQIEDKRQDHHGTEILGQIGDNGIWWPGIKEYPAKMVTQILGVPATVIEIYKQTTISHWGRLGTGGRRHWVADDSSKDVLKTETIEFVHVLFIVNLIFIMMDHARRERSLTLAI